MQYLVIARDAGRFMHGHGRAFCSLSTPNVELIDAPRRRPTLSDPLMVNVIGMVRNLRQRSPRKEPFSALDGRSPHETPLRLQTRLEKSLAALSSLALSRGEYRGSAERAQRLCYFFRVFDRLVYRDRSVGQGFCDIFVGRSCILDICDTRLFQRFFPIVGRRI